MADLSLVTDNYLPTASETFSDNLSGSIVAGAGTVPVNSAAEYADGETVVLTVEPGTVNEATFVGKKDTGVNQFIECIWTEGNTAVGHDAGATIIDYDSATHYNLLSKALQLIMNQDGTLKDDPIRTALGLSDASNDGWEVFPYTFTVSSGYHVGDHLYNLTVANQDVTGLLSEGMKLRVERSTAPGTQCVDLEASSSQNASRASGSLTGTLSTFTDDYTTEAWIRPESFTNNCGIISRYNGTSGWIFGLRNDGRIWAYADQGANVDEYMSYVRVQLDVWTHLAASMDCSGNSCVIYLNGVSVTVGAVTQTATALVQAGNLELGSYNGGNYFDGKISDVRVWGAVRTATEIRDNMNQQLVGTETNLIGYWKLSGNFNDSHTSANNLTGNAGAVATNSDNPFSTIEYVTVGTVSYSAPNSTVQVLALEDNCIPNMTLSSPYYSVQDQPFGFPIETNALRMKTVSNHTAFNPVNATRDMAADGVALMVTVQKACFIDVDVSIGVGATSDFEFYVGVYVNGAAATGVSSYTPNAALGSAGGRAMSRTCRFKVPVAAGTSILSATLGLVAGGGYTVAVNGSRLTATVPGKVGAR